MPKYVFITGGVLSGIGKGVSSAAVAKLFQFRGFNVDVIKIDPYLNVDPGTLNPIEHGEVFVTEDVWEFTPSEGFAFRIAETDQDFGTYERFLDKSIHPHNSITGGQVYLSTVLRERAGEYSGRTVQMIPHITDEIKRRIRAVAEAEAIDVLVVEIGGTVGDIEGGSFLEAVRQFRLEEGHGKAVLIHVTLVPYLGAIGQLKTKPTQHSVKTLLSAGLQPDVVLCRSEKPLTHEAKEKISLYSNTPKEAVISGPEIPIIYELPLLLEAQGLGDYLCKLLDMRPRKSETALWEDTISKFKKAREQLRIAMPGKYVKILDSYVSICEALKHASAGLGANVEIEYVDIEPIEKDPGKLDALEEYDGILLTPGFGTRGAEGMITAAGKALSSKIPFLGICFGAQSFFIAFCRSMDLREANSAEVDPNTPCPVVDLMPEQREISGKSGTMRLGGHEVFIKSGTKLFDAYGSKKTVERFRHRYHIIPSYTRKAEKRGLVVSATDESGEIINAIETKGDHWMVGVQFHPEFTSRPNKPSPVYTSFIRAALERKSKKMRV
jgi:CTP synthase